MVKKLTVKAIKTLKGAMGEENLELAGKSIMLTTELEETRKLQKEFKMRVLM